MVADVSITKMGLQSSIIRYPGILSFGLKELYLSTTLLVGWQCWIDFQLELDTIKIVLLSHQIVLTMVETKHEIIFFFACDFTSQVWVVILSKLEKLQDATANWSQTVNMGLGFE